VNIGFVRFAYPMPLDLGIYVESANRSEKHGLSQTLIRVVFTQCGEVVAEARCEAKTHKKDAMNRLESYVAASQRKKMRLWSRSRPSSLHEAKR